MVGLIKIARSLQNKEVEYEAGFTHNYTWIDSYFRTTNYIRSLSILYSMRRLIFSLFYFLNFKNFPGGIFGKTLQRCANKTYYYMNIKHVSNKERRDDYENQRT